MKPVKDMARWMCFSLVVASSVATTAQAGSVALEPSKDNTLYEPFEGIVSNGQGDGVFVGRTGAFANFVVRRAVLAFDVAGNVPAGATVTSASLQVFVILNAPGSNNELATLHRLLSDWGEGISSTALGDGAAPQEDDATWEHTFFPDQFWANMGGDFVEGASASTSLGSATSVEVFGPTAELTADVQDMLDNPAANFGWIIIGNEAIQQTARKLGSRENFNGEWRPVLTIEFEAPPCPADCADPPNGVVDIEDLLVLLAQWGSGGSCDIDGGGVSINDLLMFLAAWGPCS